MTRVFTPIRSEEYFCRYKKKIRLALCETDLEIRNVTYNLLLQSTKYYLRNSAIEARTTSFAYVGLWTP